MSCTQQVSFVAELHGLGAIAVDVPAHGGPPPTPKTEREEPSGTRAATHGELERPGGVARAGRTRSDGFRNAHLRVDDDELARGRVDLTLCVWHDAYGAALEIRTWEGMIAVGDALMRVGHAARAVGGARMNARDAYLTALIRARQTHSVDGALRSAEAFQALGDRVIVEQCLHVAAELAAADEPAQQRVREARQRWAALPAVGES